MHLRQSFAAILTAAVLPLAPPARHAIPTYQHGITPASPFPPNVRVTHDRFVAHAEPYLAVNPHNPRNLLGAVQYLDSSTLALAGTFTTFDGGRSWRDNGPLPMPRGFNTSLDVTVVFDTSGAAVVAALLSNAGRGTFSARRGIAVWRTTDGGRHFSAPVVLARGQFADHPWLAIDPPMGPSGRPHQQTVYLVWANQNGLSFSRSTDDGHHFSTARTIRSTGQIVGDPVMTVGPPGRVNVVYYSSTADRKISIRVSSSADGGRVFAAPRTVPVPRGETLLYGKGVPSSRVAAVADARHHFLYVVYAAYRGSLRSADTVLARSPDSGRSWYRPVRVNQVTSTPTVNLQPEVAATAGGRVAVSYFALSSGRMNVYLAWSHTHGARFTAPRRINDVSFDPTRGIKTIERGHWWIGDYQGLTAGASAAYLCWNDTRSGRLEIYVATAAAA